MGFRFRKSKKIGPFRINFSKSGVGYSVGGKGFRVTKRADGKTQTTASLPGTGIAYTQVSGSGSAKSSGGASGKKKGPAGSAVLIVLLLVGLAGCMAIGGNSDEPKTPEEPAATVTESAAAAMTQKEDPEEPEPKPPAEDPEELPAAAPEEIPQEQPEETPSKTPAETPQEAPEAPQEETPAEPEKNDAAPVVTPPAAVESEPSKEKPAEEAPATVPKSNPVIGNRNSKIYHEPGCSSVNDMKEKNKVNFDSAEAAKSKGYKPCARCH